MTFMSRSTIVSMTPPAFLQPVRRFRARAWHRRYRHAFPSSYSLWKSTHFVLRGTPILVLGNGPSLADIKLQQYLSVPMITMNKFGLHPEAGNAHPLFHCAADPPDFEPNPFGSEYFGFGESFGVRLDKFFAPERDGKLHALRIGAQDTRFVAVHTDQTWDSGIGKSGLNLSNGIGPCHSTAILAIAIAIHLGGNPIILLGLDHDMLRYPSGDTQVMRGYQHFYGGREMESLPKEKAISIDSTGRRPVSYLDWINVMRNIFSSHYSLLQASRFLGLTIVNATPGSFLDVYPQETLPDASLLTPRVNRRALARLRNI